LAQGVGSDHPTENSMNMDNLETRIPPPTTLSPMSVMERIHLNDINRLIMRNMKRVVDLIHSLLVHLMKLETICSKETLLLDLLDRLIST
jgi:hypothetical protein